MSRIGSCGFESHPGHLAVREKRRRVSGAKSKRFVSLLFHTGVQIPGPHPGLEGDTDRARVMRFADVEDVARRSHELTDLLQAWCRWKDD